MKKIITTMLLLGPVVLIAQTATDVSKALRYRKYSTAEKTARQLIATQPVNAAHWYWLTQVMIQEKDSAGLAKLPSALPQEIVKDPWYEIVTGAVSLNNGLTTEARQHFDAAVKATRGKNPEILAA
ncbi:MAG TPA: hypothetical protein VF145_06465, partial [Chitinophagaceae bacterium]